MSGSLEKGVFLLSLDTELAWGGVHNGSYASRRHLYEGTRGAIDRLLALAETYEIHATWAVVGHLFLRSCDPASDRKHPEIVRAGYSWFAGDWFDDDPCSDASRDPHWYGPDILERILECRTSQEIGCHTFSHIVVGDPGCSRECFDSELKACIGAAEDWGLTLRSFVFPRNQVGHLDVLAANGFVSYRGNATAVQQRTMPAGLEKLARGLRWISPLAPLTTRPVRRNGIWDLPACTYYLHRDGLARAAPVALRVGRARSGIKKAIREQSLFHMYLHPFNLVTDPDGLLKGLESIFRFVDERRSAGELLNLTMGALADELSQVPEPAALFV